jgi:hypothetical protein
MTPSRASEDTMPNENHGTDLFEIIRTHPVDAAVEAGPRTE